MKIFLIFNLQYEFRTRKLCKLMIITLRINNEKDKSWDGSRILLWQM